MGQFDQRIMLDIDNFKLLCFKASALFLKHFIIINGINECNKSKKNTFLNILKKLYSKSFINIKLFITVRNFFYNDLYLKFKPLHTKNMKNLNVKLDIQNYIHDMIYKKFYQKFLIISNTKLLFEIEEILLQQTNEM